MPILIVDTSTEKSVVVFADGTHLLLTKFLPVGLQSSKYLISHIELGFKELNMSVSDLEAIAVTVGPGSFTGIRVGVAFAKGLAFAKSLPLISLCSLSGFISPKEGPFISMIDARSSGSYILHQERRGDVVVELSPPRLVSRENLSEELVKETEIVGPENGYPDAQHLANIASKKYILGDHLMDLDLQYLTLTSGLSI